mgnify:CR=1 FL=1
MLKIGLCGCNGRMGKVITDIVSKKENMQIVAGFDAYTEKLADYPVYADPHEFTGACDVIIDFSNVSSLDMLLDYCVKTKTPVIFCTTGYDKEQLAKIREASAVIPVFRSGNMSIGINLMMDLLRKAATVLGDGYDVEITEKHHNQKLDAPSGTALALADAMNEELDNAYVYKYDRSQERKKREKKEIGISAVRGGTIVGEHEVIFAGTDEVITFKHTAYSKSVFAKGAVEAAKFLAGKLAGYYDMKDVIAAK